MQDAAGQVICRRDTVRLNSLAACAGRDCGLVLKGMPGPSVVVQRLDGSEAIENACDVRVADRSFLCPGMVVTSASDRGGQLGVVTGADVELDLIRLDGENLAVGAPVVVAARAVAPAELRRVRAFSLGDYVVSGTWLGRVFEVDLDVDLLFDDGAAVCRVTRAGTKLRPVCKDSLNAYTNCAFYPGQRVAACSPAVFKASRWLTGHWKPGYAMGTVSKVETADVLVYWIASSELGTERSLLQESAPPHQQRARDLTFFRAGDAFGFWGVGDRCFFRSPRRRPVPASAGDVDATPSPDDRGPTTAHRHRLRLRAKRSRRGSRSRRRRAGLVEPAMSVACTRTTVDVLWQDGTRQRHVPSVSIVPSVPQNDHEFFPGQRVVAMAPPPVAGRVHGGDDNGDVRVGVVRSLSYNDQTVRVSWLEAAARAGQRQRPIATGEETVSTYHLGRDSNCRVFYGDAVVRHCRLTSSSMRAGTQRNQKQKPSSSADDLYSWVGHIVDFCEDGHCVQVKWADGNTSKVTLDDVAVVEMQSVGELLNEIGEWASEDGDMNNTIDKARETAAAGIDDSNNGEEDDDDSDSESESNGDHAATASMHQVGVAIHAVFKLAGKVLAQGRRYLQLNGWAAAAAEVISEERRATENLNGDGKETLATVASINGGGDGNDGATREVKGEADATRGDKLLVRFPKFEISQSPTDHHYLDNMEQGGGRKWTKRVQKEWKILQNSLPDTIYMRVFEDRMDLLRAVMVGASGTPYHDGLFFFDLQLPPSYPTAPPLVNYRSFGLRVNPNLYPSGTVCLSLLGTFGGHDAELWSPDASTILQVVVSIQGLILNGRPYYNEAGHAGLAGTPEGRRNELPYSENTYLLTLQTMLHLLRRSPAGFEGFVRDHFLRRGRHILMACRSFLEGCPVGMLDEEARASGGSRERPCSAGFRLALGSMVPRLVEAFSAVGVKGCEEFDRL